MNDPIWFKNPVILINRYIEFVPTTDMNTDEKLNSIVRLSIILAFVSYIYSKNILIFLLPVFVIGLTLIISRNNLFEEPDILFDKTLGHPVKCSLPTQDNPYMNYLVSDDPKKSRACDINEPRVKDLVDYYSNVDMYRDVGDIYNSAQRGNRFYTLPVVTPSKEEQQDFINFCYKNKNKTCKEFSGSCELSEDLRSRHKLN